MKTRRFVSPDGLELVADDIGPEDAPVVVLQHGGGQTRHSWSGTGTKLAGAGYRVINLDGRGHGESAWASDGDYDTRARAGDLKVILDAFDRPLALVGASMGGVTALYAVGNGMAPLARALVLVDIVPRPARKGIERITAFMQRHRGGFDSLDEAVEAVASYNPHRPRPTDPSGLRKNLKAGTDGRLYWHWDPNLLNLGAGDRMERQEQELAEACSRVRIPTLLVRGAESDVVDHQSTEDFRMLLPHLEVSDVSGAGHMVAGDRNDIFSRSIVSFLRRHLPLT